MEHLEKWKTIVENVANLGVGGFLVYLIIAKLFDYLERRAQREDRRRSEGAESGNGSAAVSQYEVNQAIILTSREMSAQTELLRELVSDSKRGQAELRDTLRENTQAVAHLERKCPGSR